jgi:hypothetical protein
MILFTDNGFEFAMFILKHAEMGIDCHGLEPFLSLSNGGTPMG